MHVLLTGPCLTASFREELQVDLPGAPSGQVQTPINPLAVELIRRGHRVSVVTLDPEITEPIRYVNELFSIVYVPRRLRARHLALDLFAKEIAVLTSEMFKIKPEVVHAHWTYEYAESAVRTRFPLLVTAHDAPLDNVFLYRDFYRAFRFVMAARTLPRVKHLTCVSNYLRPHMRSLGYFRRIDVIPNGIDLKYWSKPGLSAATKGPVIVTVGDRTRRKNVWASIVAFRKIRAAVPTAMLHLFGFELNETFIRDEANVIGHGQVSNPELKEFLQTEASLLIHPSLQEICPVAIIEAMACGLPCVAGRRSGGVPDLFRGLLSNCLVDVRRPEAIAEKAISILNSKSTWRQLSDQMQDNVRQNFSIDIVASRYEALYHSIALNGSAVST